MILNSTQQLTQLEQIVAETALVAMIRQEPDEILRVKHLEFRESYDNLDFLIYTTLPLRSGNQVSLVRHKHSPDPGIEICVNPDQLEIGNVISETLAELALTKQDLTWVHPDYQENLIKEKSSKRF